MSNWKAIRNQNFIYLLKKQKTKTNKDIPAISKHYSTIFQLTNNFQHKIIVNRRQAFHHQIPSELHSSIKRLRIVHQLFHAYSLVWSGYFSVLSRFT